MELLVRTWTRRTSLSAVTLGLVLTACTNELTTGRDDDHDYAGSPLAVQRPIEGFPTDGPRQYGYVYGRDGQPRRISYEVHHGLAVLEGDIILGRAAEIPRSEEELRRRAPEGMSLGVAIDLQARRWTKVNGVTTVFYEIDPALPDPARVRSGIALVEAQVGAVFFYDGGAVS